MKRAEMEFFRKCATASHISLIQEILKYCVRSAYYFSEEEIVYARVDNVMIITNSCAHRVSDNL